MRVYFVYDSIKQPTIDPNNLFLNLDKNLHELVIYDTSYTKEFKKGRMLMGRYAAKELPFLLLVSPYKDNEGKDKELLIKVLYGEENKEITQQSINDLILKYEGSLDN